MGLLYAGEYAAVFPCFASRSLLSHPYAALTPDVVLDACASIGLRPDGRLLGLNSYENRVYQVYLEEGPPVVAKFYRPERWSSQQIAEEHAFARELAEREIPVIAPAHSAEFQGFAFAVYPPRRPHAEPRGSEDPRMDRALHRAHPRRGRDQGLRVPRAPGPSLVRLRAARLAPQARLHSRRCAAGLEGGRRAIAGIGGRVLRARGRDPDHPPARRLPRRQYPVDR